MQVHLLGTAAGGGIPQWNCNCPNCRAARSAPGRALVRTQSCVAISGDRSRWFLVNAAPDIRFQVESFPPLWPPRDTMRGTAIAGVLLSSADLDHTLGLFNLRESGPLVVHATPAVRRTLIDGLNIDAVLSFYHGILWREPPGTLEPLRYPDGSASRIEYAAFAVAGNPPRYQRKAAASEGDVVGYRFVDVTTGGRLVVIPGLAAFDDRVATEAENADLLLLDGTCFDEDETAPYRHGNRDGRGNGPPGSRRKRGQSGQNRPPARCVAGLYSHQQHQPHAPRRFTGGAAVLAAGVKVGSDGMEFSL